MRYYLDTNILAYFAMDRDEMSPDVTAILTDYNNRLLTSSICVHELIHIIQIGKLRRRRKEDLYKVALDTYLSLERIGVEVIPISAPHFILYAQLPILGDHRDPFDRLIISQSMADHIPIISSDGNFPMYEPYGLQLIRNER